MTKWLVRRGCRSVAALSVAYGAYVGATWLRYGRPRSARANEADPLLDRFMPEYEVAERHAARMKAPAAVTLAAAFDMDLEESRIARAIFRAREFLLRARPDANTPRQPFLAGMKALGWGVLAEVPGREIVMGAVTQPWVANPVFRALPPDDFISFRDPAFVKIAWTLRADPITASTSVFRTETRVVACGSLSRSKFRRYWAFLSPGIILIRLAILRHLKREAERLASAPARRLSHLHKTDLDALV